MAPNKKSKVWKYFEKTDDKTARCKLCQKCIRTSGNTTNLMGHIKNVHKALNLELKNINHVKKNSDSDLSSSSTSTKDMKEVNECTSTSSLNPKPSILNAVPDQTIDIDCDTELFSKRLKTQKSIKNSFEEIYSYTSTTGDKAKQINNAILYMICKDNQPFSMVEYEGFKNLLKITAPHYKIPSRTTVTQWLDEKYDVLSTILKC
ncbi:hypothetical protein KPH14_000767 [Odynerus spinipes]|uniref:BED-type domain-containing protein n=1 Tax=Odynerus spinipes TaxID=1348599 RepID=A0AAD9VKW5_9HYME|nr:hypothetical protein KPH14_000767 [Odynerus spinipes]